MKKFPKMTSAASTLIPKFHESTRWPRIRIQRREKPSITKSNSFQSELMKKVADMTSTASILVPRCHGSPIWPHIRIQRSQKTLDHEIKCLSKWTDEKIPEEDVYGIHSATQVSWKSILTSDAYLANRKTIRWQNGIPSEINWWTNSRRRRLRHPL